MPNDAVPVLRQSNQPRCKYAADGCDRDAAEVCIQCHEAFCPDHASSIDPAFCAGCLSPKDAEIERRPLVDEDGVTHAGSLIIPIGPAYKTLATRISEMSDDELDVHITEIKKKIHETEIALDKHRIDLSVSGIEQEERVALARKKLRGKTVTIIANNKSMDGDTVKTKRIQNTIDTLKKLASAMGLDLDTPEKVTKFAGMLAAMNKNKPVSGGSK